MPLYGSLDSLLEYQLSPRARSVAREPTTPSGRAATLDAILADKARCLSDILLDIDRDIASRKALSRRILSSIQAHYTDVKNYLLLLSTWQLSVGKVIEMRRGAREKQLDTFLQEARQERVLCWQDVAALRKEFRNWFKQYFDLVQRAKLLAGHEHS